MKNLILFVLIFLSSAVYSQEKRLALVIGNSAYEHIGVLRNPVNDAVAMKRALSQSGFEVIEYLNLNQSELKQAIDDFGLRLKSYDVGLFFYAGHGIQANGENYLIPVDANLTSEQQVEFDCVEAARVLAQMDASSAKVNIVILDACRNNPFERSWSRSASGKGLAFMNAPTGTLIAYATAPGSTASDGTGVNGLYTQAILESMKISGITILEMFQNVRSLVTEQSEYRQTPWESTSLIGNFYFSLGDNSLNETGVIFTKDSVDDKENGALNQNIYDKSSNGTDLILSPESISSDFIIDVRDGQDYKWVQIGDQKWIDKNINFATLNSFCYKNQEINCETYGRLYTWGAAQQACPSGWHLPSDEEWKELEVYLGMTQKEADKVGMRGTNEGGKIKQVGIGIWYDPNTGATNESGFSALPSGFTDDVLHRCQGINKVAWFWTSSLKSKNKGYSRILSYKGSGIKRLVAISGTHRSVRCVKD